METGISLQAKVSKKSAKHVSKVICDIFNSAQINNMDQATVQKALEVVVDTLGVKNSVIQNVHINSDDRTINVD